MTEETSRAQRVTWRFLTYLGYIAVFILLLIISFLLYLGGDAAARASGVMLEVIQGAVAGAVIGLCIGIYRVISRRLSEVEPVLYGDNVERVRPVEWAVTLSGVALIAGVFPLLLALHFVVKKDPEAYLKRAELPMSWGNYDMALAYLSKAIKTNPQHVPAYKERGRVYWLKASRLLEQGKPIPKKARDNYEKAIQDYTTIIKIDPKSVDAYYLRARVYSEIGDWNGAILEFTKIIAIDSKLPWVYYERGEVYSKKGDWNKAIEDYTTALNIAPKDSSLFRDANRGLGNAKEQSAKRRKEEVKARLYRWLQANRYSIWGAGRLGFALDLGVSDIAIVEGHAWAVGYLHGLGGYGRILHSSDSGDTWEIQWRSSTWGPNPFKVQFVDEKEGWVGTDKAILQTFDGGRTWNIGWQSPNSRIREFRIVGRQHIWARLSDGNIIESKDGGKSWQRRSEQKPIKVPMRKGRPALPGDGRAEEERKQAELKLREQKEKQEVGLPPGRYEVVRPTPLLQEARSDAMVIVNLSPKTIVNVEGATGDYLKVVSKHGRPPGYVFKMDVSRLQEKTQNRAAQETRPGGSGYYPTLDAWERAGRKASR
jgi:tetratricopeptide (TPR) repeat protein